MILRFFLAIILFAIIFSSQSSAQIPEPVFKHFTPEDGLPTSQIYQSMQDVDGYMWFATDAGVVKYNGYEFKTFTTKDGLTDNVVFRLFQDYKKRIWMIAFSGRIFVYENNKITPYKYNYLIQDLLKGSGQLEISVDSSDHVFVSSLLGVFMIDRKGVVIQKFKFNGNGKTNILLIDEQNEYKSPLAVGSAGLNTSTDLLYFTKTGKDSIRMPSSQQGRFNAVRLKKNLLLFSIGSTLFELKSKSVVKLAKFPYEIINLVKDDQKGLWVCTMKGLYLFYKEGNYNENYHYLIDKYISNIIRDKEDGYWITTIDDGVYYLINDAVKNYASNEKLKSPVALTVDKFNIYAGYFSGSLARINANEFSLIIEDYSGRFIDCIFYDTATTRLYIGNNRLRYMQNNTFFTLGKPNSCLISFVKSKQRLFTGAYGALCKIAGDSVQKQATFKTRINCIYTDKRDVLLLGCIDGVYKYDETNKTISLINPKMKDVRVDDIELFNTNLCFATQGKGLIVMMEDSTYKSIDASDGLCSDIIRKIQVNGNVIWCVSNNGISKINFTDFQNFKFNITNIGTNEGLISNEINDITTLNDTIWVASKKGISFFNSNTDFVNDAPPLVHFISFRVNNVDTSIKDSYRFPHTFNTIGIGFEAPLFKSDGKQIYEYLLTNGDDSIRGTTTNREVDFLSLKPGTYSLIVSAVNNSGIWSVQPAMLHFTILAPWWQTVWFRFALLVVITAASFVFYMNRVKKLKEKFNMERKQATLQLTAMRSQMNPHFIFNVMSSIRSYMQANDMASAEKYITSFAKLVRYTLDNSAIQEVTLEEELQALQSYAMLEMQRIENGFDFEIECDETIDKEETMLPSLLLQPFVENAIKHGIERLKSKGKIRIEIKKRQDSVLIAIEDNGVGREDSSGWNKENRGNHTSHGSKLTMERIDAYNRAYNKNIKVSIVDLAHKDSISTGTRVEIAL